MTNANRHNLSRTGIRTAGVDEVGRGPLAGPVVAAAVILNPDTLIIGLMDSKKLSAKKREILAIEITNKSLSWAIGRAETNEIDELNILQASLLAMTRAVTSLSIRPNHIMVDGLHCPRLEYSMEAVVRGDSKIPEISAASIIAKVFRDNEMIKMDSRYPGYGFAKHKGYPTKQHLLALEQLGVSPIHRYSYAPVKRYL